MNAETIAHHADCEEWTFVHDREIRRDEHGLRRAYCVECNIPLHPGAFGPAVPDADILRHGNELAACASAWVPCDGRCQTWE